MTFEDLHPEQQFMVMSSTPPLQLQNLVSIGIIPEHMVMSSSSGRGGQTKRRQQRKNKTRRNNKQRSKR